MRRAEYTFFLPLSLSPTSFRILIPEKITNIKDKPWRFCCHDDSRLVIFAVVAIHPGKWKSIK